MWLLQAQAPNPDKTIPPGYEWGTSTAPAAIIAGAVLVVVVVILLLILRVRARKEDWRVGAAIGNEDIFSRLCQANNLTRNETFLMRKMVFELKLDNPLMPFVDPRILDRFGAQTGRGQQAHLRNIKTKLFA